MALTNNLRLPFIIGSNYAGAVSAVGENVTKFAVGDSVFGLTLAGQTAAEYALIQPDFMSFEDAACLTTAGHTIVPCRRGA
jgi:NADPH:quinone reductase-like Zn-dependent oxidoreductase